MLHQDGSTFSDLGGPAEREPRGVHRHDGCVAAWHGQLRSAVHSLVSFQA